MNILETLSNRLKELKETQAELELVLDNLQSCNEEIALIERMVSLGEVELVTTPTPPVVIETPVGEVQSVVRHDLRTPEEPTTPSPRRHTPEELFRLEGRIL